MRGGGCEEKLQLVVILILVQVLQNRRMVKAEVLYRIVKVINSDHFFTLLLTAVLCVDVKTSCKILMLVKYLLGQIKYSQLHYWLK